MRRLKLRMGLERVSKQQYAGHRDQVAHVNRQLKELELDILDIFKQLEDESPEIMIDVLEPTFIKSQTYTPYDKGPLVNSGYLEENSFRGQPRVEMGYGKGGYPHYAALQHENMGFYHKPPTRAK